MTADPFDERIILMRRTRLAFRDAPDLIEAVNAAVEFFNLYDELVSVLDPDGSWDTAPPPE